METVQLLPTRCAICQTEGNATELYPANVDAQAFSPTVFSARRLPDHIHYRLVRCDTCGLVRSDPVAPPELLAELYSQSTLDYGEQIPDLKLTYGRYLSRLEDYGVSKGALLEIGCGNGFLLEEALRQGYAVVRGVEPSHAAVASADSQVRPNIVCDIMRSGLFESEQFDAACMFQVFDHVSDPRGLLDECLRVLKPGGLIICICHNITSVSARLLKDRSPIIDIEHTYLYGPETITSIFVASGFKVRTVGPMVNTYTLRYLLRLLPVPLSPRKILNALQSYGAIAQIRLTVPLGNLFLIAQR